MNEVARFPKPFPPPFASAWGDDTFGLWAEFRSENSGGEPVVQTLRWIEPGTFLMGSPDDEPERYTTEGPQHEVTISQGFWLADTACTQALWQAVMDNKPSRFFKDDPNQPVEKINWHKVQEFIQRLQVWLPGCQVDLPSEAEWEYVCRAGTDTPFSFGATISPQQVNYDGNDPYAGGKQGEYRSKTVPVKTLPANSWGLYEMHGNVWEWCKDGQRTYSEQAQSDPLGPLTGEDLPRVVRGGSWRSDARRSRSAYRRAYQPGLADYYQGFRFCLRSIQSGQQQVSPVGTPGWASGASSDAETDQRELRIHKLLADAGIGSLREIENKIRAGKITINGQRANLGDHCSPSDRIEIDGILIEPFRLIVDQGLPQVIIYYKAAGEVVSHRDPEGRPVVFEHLPELLQGRWVPVGRMEVNTQGLLLFTTDGKLADCLMKSSQQMEQKYAVRVKGPVDGQIIQRLQSGIMLEEGFAKFDSIQPTSIKPETSTNLWFYISLRGQGNQVVRRLFESQGVAVNGLIRIKFADLELPKEMKPRTYIHLSSEQVEAIIGSIGL